MRTISFVLLLLLTCHTVYSQSPARKILDLACKTGAEEYADIGRRFALESLKIASETEANSPERTRRLDSLGDIRDRTIGELKARNRKMQEELTKSGISGDIMALYRQTMDATIYIAFTLAIKNPKWDAGRIVLEVQEECEKAGLR